MKSMRRFLWIVGFGSLLSAILFAWFSPYIIVWYASPPKELAISCSPAMEWAISAYRKVIFTGFVFGALLSSVAFFAFFRPAPAPATAQDVLPKVDS